MNSSTPLHESPLAGPSAFLSSLRDLTGDAGRPNEPFRRPAPVLAEDLGMGALLRFKSLMAAEGHSVHVARMCYDRLYAHERIACAHASACDPLQRLALELFQVYHRRDEARQRAA